MFDLIVLIQHRDATVRFEKIEDLTEVLKSKFDSISDIAIWAVTDETPSDITKLSVVYEHHDPHEIRTFVAARGYVIESLQNMKTEAFYPINRKQKRAPQKTN